MKYFCFSDVHGDYDALTEALQKKGYDPTCKQHQLISCGDNFGRAENGKGSKGIYDYLTSTIHANAPICLCGNHELIEKKILFRRDFTLSDRSNGEDITMYSLLNKDYQKDDLTAYDLDELSKSPFMNWLLNRPFYYETPNYIFVHGFIPFDWQTLSFYTDDFDAVDTEIWEAATWPETPNWIRKFAEVYPNGINKTIVFGHWHNKRLRQSLDMEYDLDDVHSTWHNEQLRLYGLDACTVVSKKVNVLVVED